jgi:hypothetical protein
MPHHQLPDPGFEVPRADDPHPEPKIAQRPPELVLDILLDILQLVA